MRAVHAAILGGAACGLVGFVAGTLVGVLRSPGLEDADPADNHRLNARLDAFEATLDSVARECEALCLDRGSPPTPIRQPTDDLDLKQAARLLESIQSTLDQLIEKEVPAERGQVLELGDSNEIPDLVLEQARRYAGGTSLDEILDDGLRATVDRALAETEAEYMAATTRWRAASTRVVDEHLARGHYTNVSPGESYTSGKDVRMTATRGRADGSVVRVEILEGEDVELEDALLARNEVFHDRVEVVARAIMEFDGRPRTP